MELPLKSRGCGLGHRRRATRWGGPLFAPNRRASLIVNRPPRRNGDNLRAVRQILLRAQRRSGPGYAMFLRFPPPGPVWADASPAPERSRSPGRVCHSTLLLSSRSVTGAGRAFLPRPGLAVFRHSRVSGKRSQTLNSLGGKHYG